METLAVVVIERPNGMFDIKEVCRSPKPEEGTVRFYEDVDPYSDICRHQAWTNARDCLRQVRERQAKQPKTLTAGVS